jgi:hypothetical protein
MKLGTLPRGLAVAAIAAVTVVPLAASAAGAAPAAPTAYALFGSAQPLVWGSASSLPVGDLRVPFVWGKTNNVAVANSNAVLAVPDGAANAKPLSGEAISGLQCTGYDEKTCNNPPQFIPAAKANHSSGINPGHFEQTAAWGGKDGKFPGRISAVTDCAGNCGDRLVRSVSGALGPAGGYAGYITVGSSSASHDLSIDDKGRLISTAKSELDNVSIGPKNEVHFSSLVTTAQAFGTGAENTKDGRADLRIADFYILDNPVELTRAGLRLANGGPSEQEAYDGAKVLLNRLKKERGITLELPNFDTQLVKTPDHATVEVKGLGVRFDQQSVGSFDALNYPLDLGHATAVVVALNTDRKVDVNSENGSSPTVSSTPTTAAPVPETAQAPKPGDKPAVNRNPNSPGTSSRNTNPPTNGGVKPAPQPSPGAVNPAPPAGSDVVSSPPADVPQTEVTEAAPAPDDPNLTAIGPGEVMDKLGLRGAHSVSRAFGAFFGLGLILPLARFVIRRLG